MKLDNYNFHEYPLPIDWDTIYMVLDVAIQTLGDPDLIHDHPETSMLWVSKAKHYLDIIVDHPDFDYPRENIEILQNYIM